MTNSKIEWTDHTFNPWEGCVKVSPACDHCYAEARDIRWHRGRNWGPHAERLIHAGTYWRQPNLWNARARARGETQRVFCGSLCDVMEERRDLQFIRTDSLYPLIETTPNLQWLLLSKRPQNFRKLLPKKWVKQPRPNVIGMTTVESGEYLWRINALIGTPFKQRGLSVEPVLGPLDLRPYLHSIDWVITGGESGPQARPTDPDWFRGLRDQCQEAGVAFFFKQWGEHDGGLIRIGKRQAGRELDGREWNELPATASTAARHNQ